MNIWTVIITAIAKFFKKISWRTWIEIIVGTALAVLLIVFIGRYKCSQNELENSQNNAAAYQAELENAEGNLVQYQFSMEQLRYFNDSITKKMMETVDKLKIKDKKIQELQYMLSNFERRDTIRLHDTIFCEPEFIFDTTIGDKWMSTDLHLEYPSTIAVKGNARSEKVVAIHAEKETINPPKKCAFLRWFQKKHTVIRVNVDERNPHIISDTSRYVQIIK